MTMLTPPGEGASHRRRRPQRSHAGRQMLAVAGTVVVLLAAAVGTWAFAVRQEGPAPRPACVATTVTVVPPMSPAPAGTVTVNVLNATGRPGLAAAVADRLRARGFRVGTVANAPSSRSVPAVAEIRYGARGAAAATAVARQVGGATLYVDGRPGLQVDLVLGDGWTGLRAPQQVATAVETVPTSPAATPSAPAAASTPRTPSMPAPTCRPVPPVTVTQTQPAATAGTGR